jgi:prophage antirepressor-like protein
MFEGHEVRMAGTPSNPLFIAKDVCDVLGLKNPSVVVAALDEDERAKLNLGRQGETNCVTESGLYHLVFKSRKAAAKRFRRWVTEEVLPELRKSGSYGVNTPTIQELNKQMLNMLDMWIDRGVPAEKASACVSNTYKEAVSKALSLPLSLPSH